ncbi:MAG: dihydroorotase [Saprospiraceae bacterium]|nr:dihydroorotase [Saprospiraceae bacterium]MBK7789913.1 dihydroorotase [Saprospiraceae bacterium]MBK8850801.1 dihydroorotase [Saprospiraceae bacterium]MBK9689736.1 dihydroorotase [Saprospiraceae bacterium]MBL0081239.1 dihydroorotase [Saprospiraceae bacterium]
MERLVIKNGLIVNNGQITEGDLLIEDNRITKVGGIIESNAKEIDAEGRWVMPGIIDDQVHFREPGLTHKADIFSESKAAVAGGVTSFMEMPNTQPAAVTRSLLEDKYNIAATNAWCNYSFFMGTTNENYDEVMAQDFTKVCGLKIFMGSSTGNMLVDDVPILEKLFANVPALIATHCEDEDTIKERFLNFEQKWGEQLNASHHPQIRNEKACLLSSALAVNLARRYKTRLHILHISTMQELALFDTGIPLSQKQITSEVCVHHLWFTANDYERLGNLIKCNPAIKADHHAPALFQALMEGRLDIIATDHAPHTWDEKLQMYSKAPSGLPLVQHSLVMMLKWVHEGKMKITELVEKMCHNPALCFRIPERGFLNEGCFADIAIVNPNTEWTVDKSNIHYKAGWSPLEGHTFKGKVEHTLVNGKLIYSKGDFLEPGHGSRLQFKSLV